MEGSCIYTRVFIRLLILKNQAEFYKKLHKKIAEPAYAIFCSQKQNHARIALVEVGKKSKGSLIEFRLEKNKCRETLCNLSHVDL